MQITELDLKIKYIISFKERLELFDKVLPELVQDIRVLYFDTYDSQLDFWSDKNSLIQRLDAYEDFLLVDEATLITQKEYEIILRIVNPKTDSKG